MLKKNKIAILCPYPFGSAPSQRFRYEQYLDILKEHNFEIKIFPFLDPETNSILYLKGYILKKISGILKGFLRRFIHIFLLIKYDWIFIHREASPIGPPVFEWIISQILKKKIIYDFDDAIWLSNTNEENKITRNIKWHQKVKSICKWSYKISVGNEFLEDFAKSYNPVVVINPTTIDLKNYHKEIKNQEEKNIVVGWTGSHSTLKYLHEVIPVLKKLSQEQQFTFTVIANKDPKPDLPNYHFIKWKKGTEIEDLLTVNIGIMPLRSDDWAKGKCGFKALQYMALGIPAVVSNVGVNNKIVDHGINGYVCNSVGDWSKYLSALIEDERTRKKFAEAARKKIEESYSVESNKNNFLSLFT